MATFYLENELDFSEVFSELLVKRQTLDMLVSQDDEAWKVYSNLFADKLYSINGIRRIDKVQEVEEHRYKSKPICLLTLSFGFRNYLEVTKSAEKVKSISNEALIINLVFPSSLPDGLDFEQLLVLCKIEVWDDSVLPSWRPYDNVRHFMHYGWNHFNTAQDSCARIVSDLINDLNIVEICDIGCGSGEILSYLRKNHPDIRMSGVDESRFQIKEAQALLPDIDLVVDDDLCVSFTERKGSCALFLGNTLAHIGAQKVRQWLLSLTPPPEYLVFDFAKEWKKLLHKADPAIVCGPNNKTYFEGVSAYTHISTAGGPGWVKRGIIVQFDDVSSDNRKDENSDDAVSHSFFTKQYSDEPETYLNLFSALGYEKVREPTELINGWGTHDFFVYRRAGRKYYPWPTIKNERQYRVCEHWHHQISDLWNRNYETIVKIQEPFFKFYPLTIVPFFDTVYGRYIKTRGDTDSELFSPWIEIVDPKSQDVVPSGCTKSESSLPYGTSLFKSCLSLNPNRLIEHFDEVSKEVRIDMNSSDIHLAALERKRMGSKKECSNLYCPIPLFIDGIPALIVIASVKKNTGFMPAAASKELELIDILKPDFINLWSRFSELVESESEYAELDLLEGIVGGKKWNSWTNDALGKGIYDVEGVAKHRYRERLKDSQNSREQLMCSTCNRVRYLGSNYDTYIFNDLEKFYAELASSSKNNNTIELLPESLLTPDKLFEALEDEKTSIVHIGAHCDGRAIYGREDISIDNSCEITPAEFNSWVDQRESALELLVLNCCNSAEYAALLNNVTRIAIAYEGEPACSVFLDVSRFIYKCLSEGMPLKNLAYRAEKRFGTKGLVILDMDG